MNTYLIVKWIHILSSVVLVGTGFGSAFYMFFANRSKDLALQAGVARLVVRADWWFTTPTAILQPVTGLLLARMAGIAPSTPWLAISIGLFVLAALCWLPVVWLQIRMETMAQEALRGGTRLPDAYRRYARWWECLGYPAFIAMIAVFYLMVAKPAFVA